ncbi:hypothetical protein FIA58_020385 [Flavobacterium jejuense]|uniref:Uncharacterized protein n=1 Tax=Flavobacterium jejuense TaxID=1544455 RepID=A0ABX0IWG0_9FLAO|nr:type VI-B CRISPR-associated RNA-guided ribonuclease Cas13b [Flavobacterium jejuense]NHN28043.1 hypothetical protein [Flavobacterium jejuense]
MDNNTTLEKTELGLGITYNHDKVEDKHYFGGFFNLAQNNIDLVAQEFKKRLLVQGKDSINIFSNYFSDQCSITNLERGIKVLSEYFPVIFYFDLDENNKSKSIRQHIILLLDTINNLRNYYTHYYHKKVIIDDALYPLLDTILLKVVLEIKKKKLKEDKTKQLLKKGLEKEMAILFNLMKKEQKEKKIKGWNIDKNIKGAVLNRAFSHLLYNDGISDYRKSKSNTEDENLKDTLSESGILFLLSFFLNKKEQEQLKANIKGYKGKIASIPDEEITLKNNSLRNMATHWTYSHLTYKGLKHRIKTDHEKETLLVNMVDYLSKVPNEIYQNLSEQNKSLFLEDINEYMRDNEENNDSSEASRVIHPVIRKRYENKFAYFAIRFLDEFAEFPTLRFMVNVGNYIHDNRKKDIGGTSLITNRTIKQQINVFGNLTEIHKKKNDYFEKEENKEKILEWELFPNPSYHFQKENIPIFIDLEKSKETNELAKEYAKEKKKIFGSSRKKQQNTAKKNREAIINLVFDKYKTSDRKTVTFEQPTALLSFNELNAFLYAFLVENKTGKELEKIIIEKIANQYQILKNCSSTVDKTNDSIPKSIKKIAHPTTDSFYSEGKKIDIEKLERDIKIEIEKTNEKLETIKENETSAKNYKRNERDIQKRKLYRKYVFFTNEIGIEATWITNDILRFLDNKENWKGYQHSELQKFISQYDNYKKEALGLLESEWNLESEAFFGQKLKRIFQSNFTFETFYKKYLDNRKDTLETYLSAIENLKTMTDVPPKILKKSWAELFRFFDKKIYLLSTIETKINELITKPINLSRGVFDEKPTFINGKSPNKENDQHLFANWFIHAKEQTIFQDFYNLALETPKEINNLKKQNYKLERSINNLKIEDIYIKQMVDFLYQKLFEQSFKGSLQDLYTSKEKREVEKSKAKNEQTPDESFIWKKQVEINALNGRIIAKTKIKDIGKFKNLLTDNKITHLISYDNRIWNFSLDNDGDTTKKLYSLNTELESYERIRREKLLKQIQEFEQFLLKQETEYSAERKHPEKFEKDGNPNFKKYIIEGMLNKITPVNEIEELEILKSKEDVFKIDFNEIVKLNNESIKKGYLLIMIRNKFAHNQLIDKNLFTFSLQLYSKNENENFSEYLDKVCQKIIQEFIEKLK